MEPAPLCGSGMGMERKWNSALWSLPGYKPLWTREPAGFFKMDTRFSGTRKAVFPNREPLPLFPPGGKPRKDNHSFRGFLWMLRILFQPFLGTVEEESRSQRHCRLIKIHLGAVDAVGVSFRGVSHTQIEESAGKPQQSPPSPCWPSVPPDALPGQSLQYI